MSGHPFDGFLSSPKRVLTVGDKPVQDRGLFHQFKKMIQTGALSTLLLLQVMGGAQAGPLIQQLNQLEEVLPVATQVVEPAQENTQQIEWVNPLAQHPLSLNTDRGIEGIQIIQSWRESGIHPNQILKLSQVLVMTQSPVFVRNQEEKHNVLSLAKRTEGLFALSSQAEALEFLKSHNLLQLEIDGAIAEGTVGALTLDQPADFHDVVFFWDAFSEVGISEEPASRYLEDGTNEEYRQAIDQLIESVDATGLHTLRVPLPYWSSPKALSGVAKHLQQANQDMQTITGWDGQVLGLKGHVDLLYGAPYGMATASVNQEGRIHIQAAPDMMDHEGLHAIDFLLAIKSGYTSEITPHVLMTDSLYNPRIHQGKPNNSDLAQVWKTMVEGVSNEMAPWEGRLLEKADKGPKGESDLIKDYALTPREKIAYVFEGFAAYKLGEEGVVHRHQTEQRRFAPTKEEAQASLDVFTQVFDTLNHSFWQALPEVSTALGAARAEEYRVEPLSKGRVEQARQARETEQATHAKPLSL